MQNALQNGGGDGVSADDKMQENVGESYRLKERKEFMRQKQQIINTLFEQGNA